MSVTSRKRKYGDFEWIGLGDSREHKDELTKREKGRVSPAEAKKLEANKKRSAAWKMKALERQPATPPEWREVKGELRQKHGGSWYKVQRTRWRNFCVQSRKKGIDALPWDVYKALWNAAGLLTPPWGGKPMEAYKLQAKYYDTRYRTMMVRWDDGEGMGFVRGNCGIVLVEGHYRNHKNMHLKPHVYEVLAAWEKDGSITDREGNHVVTII
jgi:hypothetical protein